MTTKEQAEGFVRDFLTRATKSKPDEACVGWSTDLLLSWEQGQETSRAQSPQVALPGSTTISSAPPEKKLDPWLW